MYSLLSHNTFGIQVAAKQFLEYGSVKELKMLLAQGSVATPFLHIGSGSNLLFTNDYDGVILHSRIKGIEVTDEREDEVIVRVGAATLWDDFVLFCVEHGWYGAENLSFIPGEVGASAVQNIGAYGVEVKDMITAVETIDIQGAEHIYRVDECGYAYRDSIFKRQENKSLFVTYVCFHLSKKEHYTLDYGTIRQEMEKYPAPTLERVRNTIIGIRKSKLPDPKTIGNAGSFFKNPVVTREKLYPLLQTYPRMPYYELGDGYIKLSAGWMIEQCGWKGKALGRAAVYDKQALVLINRGGATGREIVALSDAIRASVREKFGTDILPEVNII